VAPAAGLFLAGGLFAQAGGLDTVSGPGPLGPSFWPRLVLVGLGLGCLAKLAAEWRRRPASVAGRAPSEVAVVNGPRLAAAAGLMLLYVVATPVIGFPLATAGFAVAFMGVAGGRAWPVTLAIAAAGTVAVLYLFVKLVYLPLPKGGGPFEAFTLALYRALRIF
jgi:hypothetical protein